MFSFLTSTTQQTALRPGLRLFVRLRLACLGTAGGSGPQIRCSRFLQLGFCRRARHAEQFSCPPRHARSQIVRTPEHLAGHSTTARHDRKLHTRFTTPNQRAKRPKVAPLPEAALPPATAFSSAVPRLFTTPNPAHSFALWLAAPVHSGSGDKPPGKPPPRSLPSVHALVGGLSPSETAISGPERLFSARGAGQLKRSRLYVKRSSQIVHYLRIAWPTPNRIADRQGARR